MANNTLVTAGAGTTIATDDVAGAHVQKIKLVVGTDDSAVMIGVIEDSAHTTGDGGIPVFAVRQDTAAALGTTDADYMPLIVDATGRLWAHVSAVEPGTGATSLGKAEDAAHTSGDVGVMSLAVRQDTAAALGTTDADYNPLIVDASGRLWVNAGAVGTITPGTAATNLGKAEDAAHTTGDVGVMAMAVRTDTAAARATTDGDYIPLTTDSAGRLHAAAVERTTTSGGLTAHRLISAGAGDFTSVKGTAGQVYAFQVATIDTTPIFFKLYNKATAPDPSADSALLLGSFLVPGAATGGQTTMRFPAGLAFSSGIGYALVTGITDVDETAVTAAEVLVNLYYT